jgi:hypothetical protein
VQSGKAYRVRTVESFQRDEADHVVPRQLFDSQPKKHLTVPCCGNCNDKKAELDDALRDYLVLDWQGSEHPVARRIFLGAVSRAVRNNHSKIARGFPAEARLAPVYDAGGLWVGDHYQLALKNREVERALEYIAKGLTFKGTGHRVSDDYVVDSSRIHQLHLSRALTRFIELGAVGPKIIGDLHERVFTCFWLPFEQAPHIVACWLMIFYDRVMFRVDVLSPEVKRKRDELRESLGSESN